MAHPCQFCQRTFSRTFNRDRHEKQSCHKRLMQNQEEMSSQNTISDDHSSDTFVKANADEGQHVGNLSDDNEEREYEYDDDDDDADDIDDKDESDEEDDDENDTGDDKEDENTDSDNEDAGSDPWDKLRGEAIRDLNSVWEEQVEEYMVQGFRKQDAEAQASNLLLPAYRKRLRTLYLHYLKWYCDLKTDPVHNKVMKTLRSFMEEDEMDYTEAAEAAITKRKYLLNRLFEYEDVLKESSDGEESFSYTGQKRKYHERC